MVTGIIIGIIVVISIFAVKSYVKKLKNGCCGAGGDEVKKIKPADTDMEHYTHKYILTIEGMTCKNCAARVENAFHEKEGFYAKVNLKKNIAEVYTKEQADEFELRQLVTRAGYQVTDVHNDRG